jgi:hypothetical protein
LFTNRRKDGLAATSCYVGLPENGIPSLPEWSLTPNRRLRYYGEEMAKRPDFTPEQPLSADQLGEMRRRFSMLSRTGLQQAYAEVWERCKLARDGRPPKAEFIQELVQVWKALRR